MDFIRFFFDPKVIDLFATYCGEMQRCVTF
jgi:hypothetical protein